MKQTDPITDHHIFEIQVSCKNLIKSNSVCYFYTKENGHYNESDHTEVVYNNVNPIYLKKFYTYYIFDTHQPIRFEFYYKKFDKEQLQTENFLGSFETDVYHLVSNEEQIIQANLNQDTLSFTNFQSSIVLKFHQYKENRTFLRGQLHARNLKKMKTFSKNNPYFEISKKIYGEKENILEPVYRSEVKSKCYGCTFKPFLIPFHSICPNENIHQMIMVTFYDHSDRKPPKEIFHCLKSLSEFMNPHHMRYLTEKHMTFSSLEIVKIPTFSDYLKSGVKLNMITAIDFTSNKVNEFQDCILSVGAILSKYLFDSKYPVFGFGGEVIGKTQFGQCFPLTFDKSNICVNSLDDIVTAYKSASNKIKRLKQANFSPIIREARNVAISQSSKSRIYSILLIITEGNIGDMKETIEEIAITTKSPLSIIIVGIGSNDFSKMEVLDADNEYLRSKNGSFVNDIVQFIPFNKYKSSGICTIERKVLDEIPLQIHSYYSSVGFILNVDDEAKQ